MKISKIFAGIAACAVSVSALAIASFADTANYSTKISLDSADDTKKMAQITYAELGLPANTAAITNIEFTVTWDCTTEYWADGGGAVGLSVNSDETTGWVQADMANVPKDYLVTSWVESISFDAEGQDIASVYADGFVQFGWWWGADPTVDISDIVITYTVGEGSGEQNPDGNDDAVTTTTTAAVTTTTTAAADDVTTTTTAAGGETTTTTAAATTTAASTTAAAANVATGVEGVASVAALLAIAGAAVVVSKKH